MPDRFHYGRITDAVHGTFGISEIESDIISTPVFQRLHNVRQLGLAHLVYPGAEYSRFAHSLGACHVAGRMLRGINHNSHRPLNEDEVQIYRLTGLLHDLGHYPFSHAMELVALDYYKADAFLTDGGDPAKEKEDGTPSDQAPADPDPPPAAYHHEPLGRAIIQYDERLAAVFAKHNISASDLKAYLSREKAGAHTNIFSSDLDCDRLDYLMRTAHCAGLPYGKVDVEYLTTQMCIDSQGHLCLTKKALRAADHLLVSRYYDYTQVAYHKTVVALEFVLRDVIGELLQRRLFDCSGRTIRKMIVDGDFANFDDQYMVGILKGALSETNKADPLHQKLSSVLNRRPPKMVAAHEAVGPADNERRRTHKNLRAQLQDKVEKASNTFGIHPRLWHIWDSGLNLSKIGSRVPLSEMAEGSLEEDMQQSVRILTTEPDDPESKSKLLVEHDFALMKQLSQSRFYAIRLFVHLPEEKPQLRADIEKFFQDELPNFPFTT